MRVEYDFQRNKNLRHMVNKALGVYNKRWQIEKGIVKKTKTMIEICLINCLVCLIEFFIIYNLFNYKYDFLGLLIFIFIVITFGYTIISLLNYFVKIIKNKDLRGEIRFSYDGIENTTESGKTIKDTWQNIKFIYIDYEAIFIIAKRNIFYFPYSLENKNILINALTMYEKNIKIIEYEFIKINKFKRFWENYGILIFLFIITFSYSMKYDFDNIKILDKEVNKINDTHGVDFSIYSHGDFGIVEIYVKKYYYEFYKNLEKYEENSAINIFNSITYDMLENNPEELYNIYYSLKSKKLVADNTIDKLIKMFDEQYALSLIEKEELNDYYEDIYLEYIFEANDEKYSKNLAIEKQNNTIKMDSLEQLIILLINTYHDWYIKDETLYFYTDDFLKEYNELYDIITEEKENNGVIL